MFTMLSCLAERVAEGSSLTRAMVPRFSVCIGHLSSLNLQASQSSSIINFRHVEAQRSVLDNL